ncbi:BatD family protein [Chryseobacterium chendengshani]|uniref:BatD family protein n=1 Tax=Chryseobacterium sp. LJ668 TaxID=2864040 RepID=UPI001C68E4BD|nr:BatD family protein [Chryseobacterium sp. LJ668]MBW8523956.1 BatD family protein [Chryseobacterium sp. LJ668]QYK16896.1 BatD family protein [Chryseobacterium sp. LJ668]
MNQKFIYILFTLVSVIAYGQVELTMKPDKSDYNGKEIVNLTIVLELNGDNLVQQSKIMLPDLSKFNIIGNGSFNQGVRDPDSNVSVEQYITRIALEPKQRGKIRIGSVLVTVNNKIYKTEPFDIFIRDIEKKTVAKNIDNDVYLNMEIEDREVYQNQATVAVLRVYSKNIDNLRKVRNIHLPENQNINVYPVNFHKSEIDPSGFGNMPSQILAMFIVFPNESGFVEIPSVSASVNSYTAKSKVSSNKVKLNVKKLPEGSPECFKNAVGNFKVDVYHESKDKIEAKKPVNVILKVSGEGNLSDMELPKIENSPDYEVFAPKITSRVKAGIEGMKGYILANYVLIPNKSGSLNIKTEEFAFFNPAVKEYINLGQETLNLTAFSHDQVLEARTTVEKVNEYTNTLLETVNSPVLKTTTFKVKEKSRFNWKVLFINAGILLGLFVAYLLFKNWQKKRIIVKEKTAPKPLGSVAETEKEIRQSLKSDVGDYFTYLENLKDSHRFDQFFATVDELDSEVRNQYFQSSKDDFKQFLEQHLGGSVAERYRNLSQRIQIEKFTPVKSEESIGELLKEIIDLYSQISK